LLQAGSILEGLEIEGEQRARLSTEVLEPALSLTERDGDQERATLLGRPVAQRDLRFGLEDAYRSLARRAPTAGERIGLVDRANRVRPRTWT
jgi:serine/threonine-protein kinase PknG